jgi:DNA repair exonuclease SbcCD nuclease subunit
VIIIAGNHDLPRSRKEACWLDLLNQIPDVHVVCHSYELIDLGARGYTGEIADVVVHALPHDTLKEIDFSLVQPVTGRRNILTSHGVAAGSELFTRSLGREYAIDTDTLLRDWEYVALGHFHKRGPVALGGTPSRIWYSGSAENISFRDLRENGTERGYLQVELDGEVRVTSVDLPTRRMWRLPVVDATGLAPEDIEMLLLMRIAAQDLSGTVVGQVVEGVTRDVWSLVDMTRVRATAKEALHYEVTTRYVKDVNASHGPGDLGDLGAVLSGEIERSVESQYRERVERLARSLLGSALAAGIETEDEASDEASPGEAGPAVVEPVSVVSAATEVVAAETTAVEKTVAKKATAKKAPAKKATVKKLPAKKAAAKKAPAKKKATAEGES